jgi:hypothetical protein
MNQRGSFKIRAKGKMRSMPAIGVLAVRFEQIVW